MPRQTPTKRSWIISKALVKKWPYAGRSRSRKPIMMVRIGREWPKKRPRHAAIAPGPPPLGAAFGGMAGGGATYRGFPVFKTLTLPCYLEVPGISAPRPWEWQRRLAIILR